MEFSGLGTRHFTSMKHFYMDLRISHWKELIGALFTDGSKRAQSEVHSNTLLYSYSKRSIKSYPQAFALWHGKSTIFNDCSFPLWEYKMHTGKKDLLMVKTLST